MKQNKLTAFSLALAMLSGMALMPKTMVAAEDWYRVESEAMEEKANIDYAISVAQQDLAGQQAVLAQKEAELNKLQEDGKVLETEYKALKQGLTKAKQKVKTAYANYDEALRSLEDKQKQYSDRLLKNFEEGRPSPMSILLSGSNIRGLFRGAELASVVADSDLQVIEKLSNAKSLAEIAKRNADLAAARANEFVQKTEGDLNKLKEGIRLGTTELDNGRQAVYARSQTLNMLQYQGAVVDANIQRARNEIAYAEAIKEKEATEPAAVADQGKPALPADEVESDTSITTEEPATEETTTEETTAAKPTTTATPETSEEVVPETTAAETAAPPRVTEAPATETPATTAKNEKVNDVAPVTEDINAGAADDSANGDLIDVDSDGKIINNGGNKETEAKPENHAKLFFPNGFSTMVTSPFGWREDPFGSGGSEFHTGTDFNGAFGAPIYAANDGEVITANLSAGQGSQTGGWGYGNYIDIRHPDGMVTRYAHLQYVNVSVGQHVARGQQIGCCGSTGSSTGPHLHFEVIINGQQVDSMNYLY